MIKPGPLQIFAIVDNAYPLINPLSTTNLNATGGDKPGICRVKQPEGMPFSSNPSKSMN
jgi:hypothetical protein